MLLALVWNLDYTLSLQIRLHRDTLALNLLTGGAFRSCNQERISWMCSLTMGLYKLRKPLKCEKDWRFFTLTRQTVFFKAIFHISLLFFCLSISIKYINSCCSISYEKQTALFILTHTHVNKHHLSQVYAIMNANSSQLVCIWSGFSA